MAAAVLLAALLAGAGAGEGAHPFSISRLEIEVAPEELRIEFRAQARTLLEVASLQLDPDGDGMVARAELESRFPAVRAYLENGLEITVDGRAWRPKFEEFEFEAVPPFLGGEDAPWFERLILRAQLALEEVPTRIGVASRLFFDDGNPDHRLSVTVAGLTPDPENFLVSAVVPRVVFPLGSEADSRAEGPVLLVYTRLGWEHVLEGLDHLAFVLALLFGVRGWRSLLAAVTAFTLAHSITLALSSLDLVRLEPRIVEPGIALSVLGVVWLHLWAGPGRARAWVPAFLFGLLHGFGFAGVLGQIGLPDGARAAGLLGFNLGVELGQLTFVVPVVAVAVLAQRWMDPAVRQRMRLLAGSVVGAAGLHLSAAAITDAWTGGGAGLPAALRALPAGLALLLLLAAALRGRRTSAGDALLPALGVSALLWTLFLAGRLLAGLAA